MVKRVDLIYDVMFTLNDLKKIQLLYDTLYC